MEMIFPKSLFLDPFCKDWYPKTDLMFQIFSRKCFAFFFVRINIFQPNLLL